VSLRGDINPLQIALYDGLLHRRVGTPVAYSTAFSMEAVVKRRIPSIAVMSLAVAATVFLPSAAFAQGRRSVRVVRRPVVIAPYYRPWFYDPFYVAPYYRWYQPPYGYGVRFAQDSSLRLQVTPRETEVFVDGYFAGKADDFDGFLQRLRLAPGEHDLELFLPGHRTVQQKIYLQPGVTFRVRYNLEPLAPGEAEPVRPAGAVRPAPPARSINPPSSGNPPSSQDGTLALRVQPRDAVVLIDGERWDVSREADRLVVQLAPGVHRIEISKDGYRSYSSEVTLRPGQTEALNVALAR
jgi:PEGA domain-containing protein